MSKIRFVGLDVHADTIAVSVAEPGGRETGAMLLSGRTYSRLGAGCRAWSITGSGQGSLGR
jgi:hypothetical protein